MGARLAFVLCLLLGLGGCASTADKAVGAAGVDLKATTALAEDSYAKGDWPTAARNYAILTQRIPQDANLWFKLGNAYARSEQHEPARHVSMTWAQRLKRVFKIDILTCEDCGGAVKVLASIEDPAVIKKILDHLDRRTTPPRPSFRPFARAPPQAPLPGLQEPG